MARYDRTITRPTVGLLLVIAVVMGLPTKGTSYKGYLVIKLQSDTPEPLSGILQFLLKAYDVDIWWQNHLSAAVMVAPGNVHDVRQAATKRGLHSNVIVEDVQNFLEKDLSHRRHRQKRSTRDLTNSYRTYMEILLDLYNIWGLSATTTTTTADATSTNIGLTFEGYTIPHMEIRERNSAGQKKHAILIKAGIHAREWMAVAMAMNIINTLVLNPDNDTDVPLLLKHFDWFIVPVVNVDGYRCTHLNEPGARLWRKTRTTAHNRTCPGVDGNRNFGFDWNPAIGGSTDPCRDTYAGPYAFSEPETRCVRDWQKKHQAEAVAYISTHSFGEWLVYPYGSSRSRTLDNKALIVDIANKFKETVNKGNNHYFKVGNSAEVMYPAAGGSDDYAKGALHIPVSYTLETSPYMADNIQEGFGYPEDKISAAFKDTWAGIKVMAKALFEEFGYPDDNA